MADKPLILLAVSDATGDLAVNIAVAAARQFQGLEADIRRRALINTAAKIAEVLKEAKDVEAVIVYTLVSQEMRQLLQDMSEREGVIAVDVMGPVLGTIATQVSQIPSDRPGMQYRVTGDYLRRTEVMTYTVKHDDGLGLETLSDADIIILGISRTSKTPLSIYLGYRGFKVANVPIVRNVDVSRFVYDADKKKLVGMTIEAEKLVSLRQSRLQKLGRPLSEEYASLEYIKEELSYQRRIFSELGNIPVINMTNKAIEEAATEILTVLGR